LAKIKSNSVSVSVIFKCIGTRGNQGNPTIVEKKVSNKAKELREVSFFWILKKRENVFSIKTVKATQL